MNTKIILLLVLVLLGGCQAKNNFLDCNAERDRFLEINNRAGSVFVDNRGNVYGIVLDTMINNNIDTRIIGLPCELPSGFRKANKRVLVSGTLFRLTADERPSSGTAGDEFYFLKINTIREE